MPTRIIYFLLFLIFSFFYSYAQYVDQFEGSKLLTDTRGINGWAYYTGDGEAEMTFTLSGKGFASINVDATKDKRGIWWALIRKYVSKDMNLALLKDPKYALRIEAKIRVSDAPKRVNLHLNTQRTTDFHSHLMEFDIPDTLNWHTISMTTKNFDAVPGDSIYSQLALMDWGFEKYRVDLDYFRVDIVKLDSAGKDKGEQVPYHPPIPKVEIFNYHLPVSDDAIISKNFQDVNFFDWCIFADTIGIPVLTVGGDKIILLRWDLDSLVGKTASSSGVLEFTTFSVQRLSRNIKDFGIIRIVEIIGGNMDWKRSSVTYKSFLNEQKPSHVLNSQMIIDMEVNLNKNGKTYAVIPKPVIQRILNKKTYGIAIIPLGAIEAVFYSVYSKQESFMPVLHLSIK